MKKILIALLLTLTNCDNATNTLPVLDKVQYLQEYPEGTYIDNDGNGLLISGKNLFKISKLTIDNGISGSLSEKYKPTEIIYSNVNTSGDGSILYLELDSITSENKYQKTLYYQELSKFKVLSNKKKKLSQMILKDNIYSKSKSGSGLINISKDINGIYYLKNDTITIDLSNKGNYEQHKVKINNLLYINLLEFFIDKNGDGWYLYESNGFINKATIDNYISKEEKLISNNPSSIFDTRFNKDGTGYILYSSQNYYYVEIFKKFERQPNGKPIIETKELSNKKISAELNQEGKGLLFVSEYLNDFDMGSNINYLNYFFKISNFDVSKDKISIFDKSTLSYSSSFINSNGSGLAFFFNTKDKVYIAKKIISYDLEK